jgi:ligand-binding sensor domain-containing protein
MNLFRRYQVLFSLAFFPAILPGRAEAEVGTWRNYTDMKNVRSVATDGSRIWAATSGGVFRFDPADSSYQKFTNSEGLTTNDVTAILIDQSGRVWMGQTSGALDVYDPASGRWTYINDIALTARVDKSIRVLYAYQDRLYIGTAFGIAVFSLSRFEFIDTYTNFASASQPAVNAVRVFQNSVVALTDKGIVVSKPNAVNLAAPESWDRTSTVTTGNSLLEFSGELYAGTESGMLKFQSGAWPVAFGIGGAARLIASTDTALVFHEFSLLRSVTASGSFSTLTATFPDEITGALLTASNNIFVGFAQNGIGIFDKISNAWRTYAPNGPNSNLFYSIVVDENSVVWGVSGRSNGKGFYSFDGTMWKNYNRSSNPLVLSDDCFAISLGPDNSKWIGTWGEGLLLVNGKGDLVRRFDSNDPGFVGIANATFYTVPGEVAVDRSGAVWATVYQSVNNNKVLWKMKRDSTWESFPGSPFGPSSSFMHGVFVDNNNTKWFTNGIVGRPVSTVAIVYFNENGSLPNTSGGWGTITESDGATNAAVYSIVADRTGDLWLATGKGITIITNLNNPVNRVSKVFLGAIRDLPINCIAVDALNNKWLGTTRGIFVLSPDGTQLLDQYNVENTNGKLVDDNVISIAFDKKRGIAYFGTEKGLSSLEIVSVAVQQSMKMIDLSPNPVYLPEQQTVEIRGLADESTIKVLSINGTVIRQFPAQGGGRAFWDCKDGDGKSVASGIYIIVAHDRTGSQVASAKVAVIRK